ncbi:MAG: hypothetical protein ACYSTL_08540, partial [Planctomycetota bacterium]
ELRRRGNTHRTVGSGVRHAFAAAAIVVSVFLVVVPGSLLLHTHVPEFIAKNLKLPAIVAAETWWIIAALIPIGIVGLGVSIWASLRWRIRLVVGVVIVAMLGGMFVERHFITRHARTGDGERMLGFGRAARTVIGEDNFAVARARKLATELYLGRFGMDILSAPVAADESIDETKGEMSVISQRRARNALEMLSDSPVRWLITCDKALLELGAAEKDKSGPYRAKLGGEKLRFRTRPEAFGNVELATEPIVSQRWGSAYLIRLDAQAVEKRIREEMYLNAVTPAFVSGRQKRDW